MSSQRAEKRCGIIARVRSPRRRLLGTACSTFVAFVAGALTILIFRQPAPMAAFDDPGDLAQLPDRPPGLPNSPLLIETRRRPWTEHLMSMAEIPEAILALLGVGFGLVAWM